MNEPKGGENGGELRQDLTRAVRKEAVSQAAKWSVGAVVVIAVVALTGWWFYLQPKLAQLLGGVPAGAIMAFDRSDLDADRCPTGWSPFLEGRARTLVGAGDPGKAPDRMAYDQTGEPLNGYALRQHGGEQAHKLTTDETPLRDHTHGPGSAQGIKNSAYVMFDAAGGASGGIMEIPRGEPRTKPADIAGGTAGVAGGAVNDVSRHNNMPPFIAVYYCRKT